MFKADTQIKYCCATNEINRKGVILPRDKPFYLFPYGSATCQPVVGTKVHVEAIQYDLENDFGNIAGLVAFKGEKPHAQITAENHLILYYCYYEPSKS